jgi:hypothetical protein
VLNPVDTEVTVWVAESSLCTVTLDPGVTVKVDGENAKFLIVMVAPVTAPDEPLGEPEAVVGLDEALVLLPHAVSTPMEMTATSRGRSSLDGRMSLGHFLEGLAGWLRSSS